jgi:hypothetical protein
MKDAVALVFALLTAFASAFAQQVPGAIMAHKPKQLTTHSAIDVFPPKPPASQPSYVMQAPGAATPSTQYNNNNELLALLQAQTVALKALAGQLDMLEQRIVVLEKRKK